MVEQFQKVAKNDPTAPPESAEDLTGRKRLVPNVLFMWAGQLVFLLAGFVMPRMMDRRLGQEVLGIWDFSWSVVSYFRLVQLGIVSSVNPFVAKYWAKKDIDGVNRVFNSANCALVVTGMAILLGTTLFAALLPAWFGHRLNGHVLAAQGAVFFLGAGLAFQTAVGAYNGVLTGCHRWELQSMRLSLWHFLTVVGMVIALLSGGGLLSLAAITFVGQTLGQLTMITLAYRVCAGLRLRWSSVEWSTTKEMYFYGAKTLVPTISAMLLNQTTSLLIVAYLGPAALAIFTRPRSLLFHFDTLERKMAMVMIPMTSSLQSGSDTGDIRDLLLKGVRYSLYLVLPMVFILIVFGGPIMHLWMGPRYAIGLVPGILAIGFVATCIQTPIVAILGGLNSHGRVGIAQLAASMCAAGITYLALKHFQAGLVGIALCITLPLTLVNLFYLPRVVCRRLGLGLWESACIAVFPPLLHLIPFAASLILARVLWAANSFLACLLMFVGAAGLAISYWRSVVPDRAKQWVRSYWTKLTRSMGIPVSGRCDGW